MMRRIFGVSRRAQALRNPCGSQYVLLAADGWRKPAIGCFCLTTGNIEPLMGDRTTAVRRGSTLASHDEDTREILQSFFTHLGAVVTIARNGSEGLAALKELRAHVIVSDLAMPNEDGLWLIHQLRRLLHGQSGSIPAVAMTADRNRYDVRQAIDAGFDAFFTKPVDPFVLAATVAKVVGR